MYDTDYPDEEISYDIIRRIAEEDSIFQAEFTPDEENWHVVVRLRLSEFPGMVVEMSPEILRLDEEILLERQDDRRLEHFEELGEDVNIVEESMRVDAVVIEELETHSAEELPAYSMSFRTVPGQ